MKRLTALLLAMCFTVLSLIPAPTAFANGDIATDTDMVTTSPVVVTTEAPAHTETPAPENTPAPTAESTEAPTEAPAAPEATDGFASVSPSVEPSPVPETAEPSMEPTEVPMPEQSAEITAEPTAAPTAEGTMELPPVPTELPIEEPTAEPSDEPTNEPTETPTVELFPEASCAPTEEPTAEPTAEPTVEPTATPEPTPVPQPLQMQLSCSARYTFANEGMVTVAADFVGGVAPYQIQLEAVDGNGMSAVQTAYVETGNSCAFTYLPATGGDHTLTVAVLDALGSEVSASVVLPVAVHDREYAGDWARSTSAAELIGDWRTDLVAVARTQLGYSESKLDFQIDDNGIRRGYTRYGAWYGAAYSEWCSMFVAFCLHFADIPASGVPQEAHCGAWQSAIRGKGAYRTSGENYAPQMGDLVFFSWYEDEEAEHIGIVESVADGVLHTIEGNVSGGVRRREYAMDDEAIVGYASMTRLMEKAGLLRESTQTMAETLPQGALGKGYTLVGSVNIRSKPIADSTRMATIKKANTGVILLDYDYADGEMWYQVRYEGTTGYIRGDLLDAVLLAPLPMQVITQPEPINWSPDLTTTTLSFEVQNARRYCWEQGTPNAEGKMTWMPIGEGNTLSLLPTVEALRCYYRCTAANDQGDILTSDVVTLLAEPYFSWLQSAPVTMDMLQRAVAAGGLDLMVLEDGALIHVRTGQLVARYDASVGYFVDCATGLIVAYIDPVTGQLAPVVTQDDIQ